MITHFIAVLWRHVLELGTHYHVDPLIFACLYVAHHPLFWGTMAWMVARVRARLPIGFQIGCAVFFWTMPYAYVLLFGRGLPVWTYLLASVLLLIGGVHAIREVKAKLSRA